MAGCSALRPRFKPTSSILAATRRFGASIRIDRDIDSRREAIHIKMNAAALPPPSQPAISPPCFVLRARFVMRSLNFHPATRATRGWKDHIGVSRSETITRSRALSNFHAGEIRAGTERPRYSSGDLIRRSHAILFAEGYTFVRTARVLVSGGGGGGAPTILTPTSIISRRRRRRLRRAFPDFRSSTSTRAAWIRRCSPRSGIGEGGGGARHAHLPSRKTGSPAYVPRLRERPSPPPPVPLRFPWLDR